MKRLLKNERGSVAYWLIFIILAIILMALFAVTIPMLQTIDAQFYAAAQPLLDKQQIVINGITDANVQASMQANLDAQRVSIPHQIEVLGMFFQYGWIIIIVIIAVVLFLLARRNVEAGIIG
jgi:uncharacterized membrane protein